IDSVDVHWEVNSVAQPSIHYIGLLDTTNGNFPNTVKLVLGSATFNSGNNSVKAWTSAPNGKMDTINFNDTANVIVKSAAVPLAINIYNPTLTTVEVEAFGGAGTVDYEYGLFGYT